MVNRNKMFTGDDFMPALFLFHVNSIYKFQVTLELVMVFPF